MCKLSRRGRGESGNFHLSRLAFYLLIINANLKTHYYRVSIFKRDRACDCNLSIETIRYLSCDRSDNELIEAGYNGGYKQRRLRTVRYAARSLPRVGLAFSPPTGTIHPIILSLPRLFFCSPRTMTYPPGISRSSVSASRSLDSSHEFLPRRFT